MPASIPTRTAATSPRTICQTAANRGCGCFCSQDGKLLPKRQVFQEQVAAGAKKSNSQEYNKSLSRAQHEISFTCNRLDWAPSLYT